MRYLSKSIILLIAFLLDSSISTHISIFGAKPSFVLVTLVIYAIIFSGLEPVIYAVFAGAVMDIFWGKVFGVNTLLLMYAIYSLTVVSERFYNRNMLMVCSYTFIFTILYQLLFVTMTLLMWGNTASFSYIMFGKILPVAAYNAVLVIPLYRIFKSILVSTKEGVYR